MQDMRSASCTNHPDRSPINMFWYFQQEPWRKFEVTHR